jgi:diguanylate cyclase (GGDEF)-like protein
MIRPRKADNEVGMGIGGDGRFLNVVGGFKVKLVLYFALLALLPAAVAFRGFQTLATRGETRSVDARLQAGLRSALVAYSARLDEAGREAAAVARGAAVQHAIADGDRDAAAAVVHEHPELSITAQKFHVGARPRLAGRRTVRVADHKRTLGEVTAFVPIDGPLLRELAEAFDSRDRLVVVRRGHIAAGTRRGVAVPAPPGAARITVAGEDYRSVATQRLASPRGVAFVALTPEAAIDRAASSAGRRLLAWLVASLVLFGFVAMLLGRSITRTLARLADAARALGHGRLERPVDVRGRDEVAQLASSFNEMAAELEQRRIELESERRRLREATARVGKALEATHDVDQLLHLVVETAVEATGAYGGLVVDGGREFARTGDPDAGLEKIAFPLRVGVGDFGSLVLAAPTFDRDQIETASSLAANAAIALENAHLHALVERQALVDALTELANRRALEDTLRAEIARSVRFGGDVAFVIADLDGFKAVNDRWGHPFGDTVLRTFGQMLRQTAREIDIAGRWGGEEFGLVLPGTDAAGAEALAERARQAVAAMKLETADGETVTVTASFGVASLAGTQSFDALVSAADTALYNAKRSGKNLVVAAPEPARPRIV